jgi:hypothetical protein
MWDRLSRHRSRKKHVANPLGYVQMKKPSKTAVELQAVVKLEMEDISEWPTDIAISVRPDGDTWKVVIMQDSPTDDRERFEMIMLIADGLRSQFDLSG